MGRKLKVLEIVLVAITAVVAVAKAVLKFIGCVDKLKAQATA